jgi:hypothetical protein
LVLGCVVLMAAESLEVLLRGSVAHGTLVALLRDLASQARINGRAVPVWATPVCEAAAAAAGVELPASSMSVIGRPVARVVSTEWVSTKVAAARVGRSERQIRRLAAGGHVIARRFGSRAWQVDFESLRGVLDE